MLQPTLSLATQSAFSLVSEDEITIYQVIRILLTQILFILFINYFVHKCCNINLVFCSAAESLSSISDCYRQELTLKRCLCREVAHADSREMMMFYSVSWMHQPYIHDLSTDLLQALLKETGHVK